MKVAWQAEPGVFKHSRNHVSVKYLKRKKASAIEGVHSELLAGCGGRVCDVLPAI